MTNNEYVLTCSSRTFVYLWVGTGAGLNYNAIWMKWFYGGITNIFPTPNSNTLETAFDTSRYSFGVVR
jgi:hypothetical protein